jgi:hypothetical protein
MPKVCDQYLPIPAPAAFAPQLIPTRYAQAQATEEQSRTIRDIWLVEGIGKNRLCNEYDVTQQRCRVWAHTVHQSGSKKKSTANGETTYTAASLAPADAAAETERKEKSQ